MPGKMIGGPLDGREWDRLDPLTNVADYVPIPLSDDWLYVNREPEVTHAWDAVDVEIQRLAEKALAWEGVARNMATVLELRDGDGILKLNEQMRAHGLKTED